jgi:hypothetical protein
MHGKTSEKVMRVLIFLLLTPPLGLKPPLPPPLEDDVNVPVLTADDSKNPIKRQVLFEGTSLRTWRFSSVDPGRLRKRLTAVTFNGSGLSLRMDRRRFSTGGVV